MYVDEKTHHLRYVLRFSNCLFGPELDDTLEREKKDERLESEPMKTDGLRKEGTGHDELTKVCAAEESEQRASQQERVRAETHKPPRPADSATEASAPGTDGHDREDQSYYGQATTAASNLATSIAAVYSALGFGNSSPSSSGSEASSRGSSPQPAQKSMHTEIDDMDDAIVERYLQSRQGSV